MTANVLGLDLGLAKAGAAQIDQAGAVRTWRYDSPGLPDDATPAEKAARIRAAQRWAVGRATTTTVLVVVEELPHATEFGSHDERAAIVWGVVDQFARHGLLVALVNPVTMKHRISGNGHADKADVRRAVAALYPSQGLARVSYDEADAVGLATLGVARLAAVRGAPWRGPWLAAQSLNLEAGFSWPRELHATPAMRPAVQRPLFQVPTR